MAVNGYFFNAEYDGESYDRVYDAEDFSSYLDKIVGNGVFPTPSTQLQVRAGSGMQIIVGAGQGYINGHKLINTADYPIAVDASDVLLNRIDRVIFYADMTEREMGIEILKGSLAEAPVAPALTRTDTRYEMSLATIYIAKNRASVTGDMITDTRADSNVCGWVAGLIQQVDTSTLFTQWQTAYSEYYEAMTEAFDNWFSTLTEELRVETFIQRFTKTVTLAESNEVELDMLGYTYNSSDVVMVFINGLKGIPSVDYTLDATGDTAKVITEASRTGTEVYIEVLKSKIGMANLVDNNDNDIVNQVGDEIIV